MNVNKTQREIEILRRNNPELFRQMAIGQLSLYNFIEGCKRPGQNFLPRNLYEALKAMFNTVSLRNTTQPVPPQQTWGQQQQPWSQQQQPWGQQPWVQQPWNQQQQPWGQQPWVQQQLWNPVDINMHLYLQNQRYV